jgi:HPt (histidine-containing phosphotransfer) domain-containing protein
MTSEPKLNDHVVAKYLGRFEEKILRIRDFLAKNDWESLKVECHRIKGSGSVYGFPLLSELGANAEKLIIENGTGASEGIQNLLSAMEKILTERKSK